MKNRLVITYTGKFQPFHLGHYLTYLYIKSYFNVTDNIFITTSDKTDEDCFMNFKQKTDFINSNFNIPKDKIIKVKSPYSPVEILNNFEPDYSFITILGSKDKDRLSTKPYYEKYMDNLELLPFSQKGYYFSPDLKPLCICNKPLNSTMIRNCLKYEDEDSYYLEQVFNGAYPQKSFNVYLILNDLFQKNLLTNKFN